MASDSPIAVRHHELLGPPGEAKGLISAKGCISSWFSAHSQTARVQMVRISSSHCEGERRDTVPLQFISLILVVCHVQILCICRCQPTGGENLSQVQPQSDGLKKREKDRVFYQGVGGGRKEEKRQRRRETRKKCKLEGEEMEGMEESMTRLGRLLFL